jgi:predicted DNA-binding transcriptional regulator AlpA
MPNSNRVESSSRRASIQPRGLSRVESAKHIGVSATLFDELVKDGRMPQPKRINARTVWDVRQLDVAFDALPSDGDDDGDPFGNVAF